MGIKSNLGEIIRDAHTLSQALNLRNRTAGGKRFGDEAADVIAAQIRDRTVNRQVDPEGGRLKALKPATIRRKLKLGQPPTVGVATGAMLDLEEVRGDVVVTSDSLIMDYGQDDEARRKAALFERGGRTFFGLDGESEKALDVLAEETLDATIRRIGG